MNTINASELIAAGYTFTIEDENTERAFSESGELHGVTFKAPEEHTTYDDGNLSRTKESDLPGYIEEEPDHEVIVDINELRDGDDRWAHYADSHVLELELQRALYLHLSVTKRDFREFYHLSQWRYRRFVALSKYAESCNSPAKLKRIQQGMWARYRQSVKACAKDGNWWALYLTSDQANSIYNYIELLLREA